MYILTKCFSWHRFALNQSFDHAPEMTLETLWEWMRQPPLNLKIVFFCRCNDFQITFLWSHKDQEGNEEGKIHKYLEKLLLVDEILHLIHICRETYIIITALPPFIVDLEHVFSQKTTTTTTAMLKRWKSTQNWEYQSIKSSEYVFQTSCFKSDHCLADFPFGPF